MASDKFSPEQLKEAESLFNQALQFCAERGQT